MFFFFWIGRKNPFDRNLCRKKKRRKNPKKINEKKVILDLPPKGKKKKIKDRVRGVLKRKKNRKNIIINPKKTENVPIHQTPKIQKRNWFPLIKYSKGTTETLIGTLVITKKAEKGPERDLRPNFLFKKTDLWVV